MLKGLLLEQFYCSDNVNNYIMKDIIVKDNFFSNVYELRKLALSSRFYSPQETKKKVNWKGFRTDELKNYPNKILNDSFNYLYDELEREYGLKNLILSSYFHLTLSATKDIVANFYNSRWHSDDTSHRYAGIVYLTPNPPKNTGTTILTGDKPYEVENYFNRMVAYPAEFIHAPTDLFGDDIDNGRLTFTFFCS